MLEKEDKDGTIEFLRERLQKIRCIANASEKHCCCTYDWQDVIDNFDAAKKEFAKISDLADKTLIDTTW